MAKYLYWMIADRVLADIKAGVLTPGMNAPSSRDLSKEFGVSQITALKALIHLARRGFLQHKSGQNYFVSHKAESQQSKYQFLTLLFRHVSTSGPEFYGNSIISGIIQEASSAAVGIHFTANAARTIYLQKYDFSKTVEEALKLPREHNLGFIADYYIQDDILEKISLQTQLPIAVIGRESSLPNVHSVVLNALTSYRYLFNTLKRLGYEAFICCESGENLRYEFQQQHQFFQELEGQGSTAVITEFNSLTSVQQWTLIRRAMESLGKKHVAILATSDIMARSIIANLEEHGIGVPAQVGVVGFYGTRVATETQPRLSCLSVHPENMGKLAVKLLLSGDKRYQVHPIAMDFVFGETI